MAISKPLPGTGINSNLVRTYDFTNDADWANPSHPNHTKFEYLTRFAVQVGDSFYVLDKTTGSWTNEGTRATAQRVLAMQRGGPVQLATHLAVVTADEIEAFFRQGILKLAGTIYAPGCPPFVIFDGQKRLNVYSDHRLPGDTDHIQACEEFLKVIRNSLCGQPDEVGLNEMLAEIGSQRRTEFRWVIHWLAACYQMPGFAPQTNLWFVGRRGAGKGTLIQIMSMILGGAAVGKVSQEDVAKGWTDCFLNKQFLEWDEFKAASGGWRETAAIIKEKTGNTRLLVNKRNVGSSTHPAVAMHIFASNEDKPIMIESDDRQNTIIGTVGKGAAGDAWIERVKALWTNDGLAEPNLPSGFAALLNEVEVDVAFIRSPLETPKRLYLKGISEDTVTKWVEGGGADQYRTLDKPGGIWVRWEALYGVYKEWVREYTHGKPEDLSGFKARMKEHGYGSDEVRKVMEVGGRKSCRGCVLTLPVDSEVEEVSNEPTRFDAFKARVAARG